MWKNSAGLDKAQMTIRRKHIARSVTKAINTHPKYVILIVYPLEQ